MKWKKDFGPKVGGVNLQSVYFWCAGPHSPSISCLNTHTHSGEPTQSAWGVGTERPEPYQQTQQGRQRKQAGEKRQTFSLTHTHTQLLRNVSCSECVVELCSLGGTVSLHFHVTSTATYLIKTRWFYRSCSQENISLLRGCLMKFSFMCHLKEYFIHITFYVPRNFFHRESQWIDQEIFSSILWRTFEWQKP